MIAAIIHLSNRNFDELTTDFVKLGFLPEDISRPPVIRSIQKILIPYVSKGGGAKFLKEGGDDYSFQTVTQELLKAQLEIPFSIPAYIA